MSLVWANLALLASFGHFSFYVDMGFLKNVCNEGNTAQVAYTMVE